MMIALAGATHAFCPTLRRSVTLARVANPRLCHELVRSMTHR